MERIESVVSDEGAGMRLDAYIAKICDISRNQAQRLIADGCVELEGIVAGKSLKLAGGEQMFVTLPPLKESSAEAQDIKLDIVYEDEHLLVVNKPKGMVVHPAAGNPDGTLVNALLHHCGDSLSGIGGELRPGIVHRIDKDTSGLLVVAKDDATHGGLAQQFAEHSITRVYHALVYGRFAQDEGEVDAPIGRSQSDRKKMAVVQRGGKPAVTTYKVLRRYDEFTYLALRLKTGRTHQIRVHMAKIHHPLAGDAVYGPRRVIRELAGQCLHAKELGFVHPASGKSMLFDSKLPTYFADYLSQLEEKSNI